MASMSPTSNHEAEGSENRNESKKGGVKTAAIVGGIGLLLGYVGTRFYDALNVSAGDALTSGISDGVLKSGDKLTIKGAEVTLNGWKLEIAPKKLPEYLQDKPGTDVTFSLVSPYNQGIPPELRYSADRGWIDNVPAAFRPLAEDWGGVAEALGYGEPPKVARTLASGEFKGSFRKEDEQIIGGVILPSRFREDTLLQVEETRTDIAGGQHTEYSYYHLKPEDFGPKYPEGTPYRDEINISSEVKLPTRIFTDIQSWAKKMASGHKVYTSLITFSISREQDYISYDKETDTLSLPLKEMMDDKRRAGTLAEAGAFWVKCSLGYEDYGRNTEMADALSAVRGYMKGLGAHDGGDWWGRFDNPRAIHRMFSLDTYEGSNKKSDAVYIDDPQKVLADLHVIGLFYAETFSKLYSELPAKDRHGLKHFLLEVRPILKGSPLYEIL